VTKRHTATSIKNTARPRNPFLSVANGRRLIICLAFAAIPFASYPGQPGSSPSPGTTRGSRQISLQTDKTTYSSGAVIRVMITNNLDRKVFAYDQKTLCTILTLERQSTTAWHAVRDCLSTQPPKPIPIAPRTTQAVPLDFRVLSAGPPSAGTYRLKLVFQLEPYDAPTHYEAYSPSFRME
jgi:hypothetical protein